MALGYCELITMSANGPMKPTLQRNVRIHRLRAVSSRISGSSSSMTPERIISLCLEGEHIVPTSATSTSKPGHTRSLSFTSSKKKGIAFGLGRSFTIPRASRDVSISTDNEKPMWWWRTAACLPYFLPLHETWNYGETAVFLQPHLRRFEFLTNPVLLVPTWFSLFYFFAAYLWLVRQKELPHFVRFHVMMGMLLENMLQIIWTVSRWMPLALFGVRVGVYFWTAVSVALFLCILECMRRALAGNYAALPYISDAAYMQIPRG